MSLLEKIGEQRIIIEKDQLYVDNIMTGKKAVGRFAVRYQVNYMDEQGLREVEIETAPTLYGPI